MMCFVTDPLHAQVQLPKLLRERQEAVQQVAKGLFDNMMAGFTSSMRGFIGSEDNYISEFVNPLGSSYVSSRSCQQVSPDVLFQDSVPFNVEDVLGDGDTVPETDGDGFVTGVEQGDGEGEYDIPEGRRNEKVQCGPTLKQDLFRKNRA